MNPSSSEAQHSLELPNPEQGQEVDNNKIEAAGAAAEAGKAEAANQGSPSATSAPATDQASADASSLALPAAPIKDKSSTSSKASSVADDVDLIEKEWVDRAKHIVEKTKDDPYLQNKEMNKAKAEYIETRWNKKIKLADEQPR